MTWQEAAVRLTSHLGRVLGTQEAVWILNWAEARKEKIESPGGDGFPPGAAAVIDLEPRLSAWVELNVQAGSPITVADLEQMDADLQAQAEDGPSWLCSA